MQEQGINSAYPQELKRRIASDARYDDERSVMKYDEIVMGRKRLET